MKDIDFTGRYEKIIVDFHLTFLLITPSKETLIKIHYLLFENGINQFRKFNISFYHLYSNILMQKSIKKFRERDIQNVSW